MTSPAGNFKALMRGTAALTAAFALSACATTVRNHGYVPSEEDLAEIIVGVDTRDSVAETVGTPSASGVLDDGGYYYVRSQISYQGLREPRVIDRELVAISFTDTGVVENIERFGLQDGRPVQLTRRVTSSSVRDQSFLRQLLGNLGRFNPGQFLE